MKPTPNAAKSIFLEAVEIADADARQVFVASQCAGDDSLRLDVERLLEHHAIQSSFLRSPPVTGLPTTEPPAMMERPGAVVGPYKLREQIGEGGFGVVFMAEQSHPVQRILALKIIKPGMDSRQVVARFEAERQALAMMDHLNIARVIDGGSTEAGRPYFVMELVHGVSITIYCDDNRLTLRERIELFIPVCHAIQHAHQKGIIHRDVKPSNVMVTLYEGGPTPKVIDFGVAKATEQKLTERTLFTNYGTMVGTLEYMSPEQAESSPLGVDTRSDVYSLGVLLYELLTGGTPLTRTRVKEATLAEILRLIKEEEPPRPSARLLESGDALTSISAHRRMEPDKLARQLRGELDWIVMKCLEKDRTRRYETVNGFAMDLQRYLADEPVSACPPSAGYRLQKFVRRNKASVSAAAVVLVTLVGGIVGTTVGFLHAERARAAESLERANAESARDHAWNALDAMTSAVTGDSLAAQKELAPEQKQFLRSALEPYRVLAEHKSNDEKSRARAAHAARRIGHIELSLGEFERSTASARSAAESFAALAAEFPESQDYRRWWSLSLSDAGAALCQLGRWTEAEPLFAQSIAIVRRLASEHPDDARYRSDAAVRLCLRAPSLRRIGRADAATESLNDAKDLLERLIDEKNNVEHHRIYLAECHDGLGLIARDRSDSSAAERHFRRAIELHEATDFSRVGALFAMPTLSDHYHNLGLLLCRTNRREEGLTHLRRAADIHRTQVEKYPSQPDLRYGLALAIMSVSNYCNNRRESITLEQSAIDVLERLVKDHPDTADFPIALAGSCCNLGLNLRQESRIPESIAMFDKAASLLEKHRAAHGVTSRSSDFLEKTLNGRALSKEKALQWRSAADDHRVVLKLVAPKEVPAARLDIALCLAKAGDASAAIAELELVERDRPLSMFETFLRSRIEATLAGMTAERKREFSDRAIADLEKALRGGLSRPLERLADADFNALRAREDFKKLEREYAEKAKAAKIAKE